MASPDSSFKTVTQMKPVLIKKGQIFIPKYPIVLRPRLKRSITNVVATPVESSAKRTCLTESNALQSNVETPIINHTGFEQTPVSNTNVIVEEEKKKVTHRKPYNARALIRCEKHGSIPEYSAEGLVEIGFTYDSIEAFQEYATMHSKKWFFYYKRSDSRNIKTSPHYNPARPTYLLYSCRFDRKYQKSKSKGIRKRTSGGSMSCPAGVTLKCKPGEDTYRVQTVCHHHTHELSEELFRKTPHGYRLPQEIKDEICDLALFNIDPAVAHRYIMTKIPDLDLRTTVYNTFRKIRSKNDKAEMSPQKITEMIAKIKYIKANFSSTGPHNKKQPVDASRSHEMHLKKKSKSQQNNETATDTDADDSQDNIIKTTRTYNKSRTPARERQQSFPNIRKSESDAIQSAENIGDITIQTTATEDETAASNLILRRVESEKDFNPSSQLINELSELESTIADQHEMQGADENTFLMNLPCDRTQLRCQRRHDELPEHHAEGLVMEGDTFSSLEEFADYAADHALKWFFYYQISDSRNIKTSNRYNSQLKSLYTFACRFDKRRYKSQSTGVRKVKPKATQCPATISMVCRPGEEDFTVTYACHHHSHELSAETFRQEAHGHRLSPELKNEIRELVWFQLEPWLIRQYLLQKTGLDLKRTVMNLLSKLRNGRMKLNVSSKRKKEILGKIEEIKTNFSILKRAHRHKKQVQREQDRKHSVSDGEERNGSRVEARLNNILHDQGLIQSIKELQQETGCEIQINSEPEMNHIAETSHLQTGLIEENYNTDNKIENDQEQYTVNENFHYTSVVDGTEFEHNNLQPGDNIIYLQIESIHDQNIYEVEIDSTGNQCDENIESIEFKVPCADKPSEEDMVSYHEQIGYKEDAAETNIQDYEADQYQLSHTNDTDVITTYDEENIAQCDENVTYLEEMTEATQQDFENVQHQDYNDDSDGTNNYEEECENIKQLELNMLNGQSNENTISVSTRGRPKVVLEERIINRYNIELYINVGGVIPCLENMAINMNVSVLELLKRLYNGEAVFKMSSGRSGKQDRKTVQLQYVPLAIAFPFDKFNYMNTLREYKKMCSNYSNMAMSLENTVESISEDLKAANEKIEMVESQNEELSNVKKCYEGLLQSHIITTQLLKQSQLDLEEAQSKNWFLSQRINELEDLLHEYQIEDYEIPNQRSRIEREEDEDEEDEDENKDLIDRTLKCQQSSKLYNTVSSDKLKTLEEKSLTNIKIIEKIKSLEETVKVSDADNKLYREKIVKLKDLYSSDNQLLLGKIKRLEEEISSLKNKLNLSEISKKSLLSQINSSELVITKLRKQIHSLEDLKTNEKKKVY